MVDPKAPRADDWVEEPLYLGLGSVGALRNDDAPAPPTLWVLAPGHGDGWVARHVERPRRALGFRVERR